ncbi:IS3 family transposase [Pandoraea capi]|uniref:IS3 family transposase n=1 Tax=Pandoraea TaxID=93217 RepID=UPI00263ACF5A|nr:IS3 family transposase [Pandoraea capi]MCI3203356.1 IS3 family transposase [Pandoraea sp. LA3]MDN4581382.1 IS3 family transposase [Pandoraea capi]
MEQGIKRTQRDYSLAFKLSVVEQVEKGELTYKQAQRRYGIQGRSTVLVWLRKHGLQDWVDPSGRASSATAMPKPESKPLTPEQRIKELEAQLHEANEKAALFEAVIDVMRKDYGVTIKKPSGVLAQKQVAKLSVERACRYMGFSRQAYYKHWRRERHRTAQAIAACTLVQSVRRRQPRLGTRKLHHMLGSTFAEQGIKLGRDRLFEVLRDARLLVAPKRAYHKTTQSHHHFRRHPNLLKPGPDQVSPSAPEQVWVADITYLPTAGEFVYLSLVTDAFSRKIVGYHVHDSLQAEHVSQALKMALQARRSSQPLIHHSDRGVQYCCTHYQDIHRKHGLTCSMTDGYDCYQNALAERVNGILKNEFLLHRPVDLKQAVKMVRQSVHIYNHERPHAALKYKTPDAVHRAF